MKREQLEQTFGISNVLTFEEPVPGMIAGVVSSRACQARFFLHGAHVTEFSPTGHDEVLFVSEQAVYCDGKAIRGGIPIRFPWFGSHPSASNAPAHGLARTRSWKLTEAVETQDGVVVVLTTHIEPFDVTYRMEFESQLTVSLTATNTQSDPVDFEAALHSYFNVSDISQVEVTGLEQTPFLDQLTNESLAPTGQAIRFSAETDRIYTTTSEQSADPIRIIDRQAGRAITIERTSSRSVVVWNPWIDKSARMADFGNAEWKRMCCIETANIHPDQITLQPNASHTMKSIHRVAMLD